MHSWLGLLYNDYIDTLRTGRTHVQSDASDRSDFALRQRGKNALNGFGRVGLLAGAEDGASRERAHSDILSLVDSQSHVDRGINGLTDQDLGRVRLGDEAHKAWFALAMKLQLQNHGHVREKVEATFDMMR